MSNKTGLIVAMKEEAKPFIDGLSLTTVKDDASPFIIYENNDTILVVSGIGELNAALAAQYAILIYGCTSLISTGCCGATGNRYHVGEIVSVEKVFKRDVDLTCAGYERYQLPGCTAFISLDTDDSYPLADCYTSDEFVTSLTKDVPRDVVVEMEAFSVAFTARKYKVPCYVYKIVSDLTDKNTDDSQFGENLDIVSSHLAAHIIALLKR